MSQGAFYDESTLQRVENSPGGGIAYLPCLTILSHPQMKRAGERALLWSLERSGTAVLTRNEPEFSVPGQFGQPLQDPFLSRKPIRFVRQAEGRLRIIVPNNRVVKVNGRPISQPIDVSAAALVGGVVLAIENRVCLLLHQVNAQLTPSTAKWDMVGESEAMVVVRDAIRQVADLDVPVLIRGETGTGKELVAQALHAGSRRAQKPFVSVSLAAVPAALAVSELFGAEKGAFTGAAQNRLGYFRAAHGGVLFLDEIGEASTELQALLLRALETQEIYPLGRQTPVKVDVRLVAATDANLENMMDSSTFKAPLLHRLAGFEIHLPPLRRRREDIGRLFLHFARQEAAQFSLAAKLAPVQVQVEAWMPADLCAALALYSWPGNIRQMRNVVRQLIIENRDQASLKVNPRLAALLAHNVWEDSPFEPVDVSETTPVLPARPAQENDAKPKSSETQQTKSRKPATITEAELRAALAANGWEYKAAADCLGIARASIYDLMERFKIATAVDLDAEKIRHAYQKHEGDLEAMVAELAVSKRALKQRLKLLRLKD